MQKESYKNIVTKLVNLNVRVYGLSNHFRKLRKKVSLTQKELSNFFDVDLSTISDYENRSGTPLKYFIKLYKKLHIDVNELVYKLYSNDIKLNVPGANTFFNYNYYTYLPKKIKKISKPFTLNIWKSDFGIIISERMILRLKNEIKKAGGIFLVTKLSGVTKDRLYRILSGKGSHIKNYYRLIQYLKIGQNEVENDIVGITYKGGNLVYPCIKNFNPLLFRIICHVIGDGNVASGNTCRWIQDKSNSIWLKRLIKQQIGIEPTYTNSTTNSCEMVTIPAFLGRLCNSILNIDIKLLKDYKTIEKFLKLPKDYKLQLLAAFVVDEGDIRYEGARSFRISQKDKGILTVFSKVLDSLNYEHSPIRKEIDKNGRIIYRINVYTQGVLKFYKDLNRMVKRYNILAGLWQKQVEIENYVKTIKNINNTKLETNLMNKMIFDIFDKQKYVSYDYLKSYHPIKDKLKTRSKRCLINKFYELSRCGKVIRCNRGIYKKSK